MALAAHPGVEVIQWYQDLFLHSCRWNHNNEKGSSIRKITASSVINLDTPHSHYLYMTMYWLCKKKALVCPSQVVWFNLTPKWGSFFVEFVLKQGICLTKERGMSRKIYLKSWKVEDKYVFCQQGESSLACYNKPAKTRFFFSRLRRSRSRPKHESLLARSLCICMSVHCVRKWQIFLSYYYTKWA